MKMFSRQFPIKRTNSRDHTTIIEGPNLFGPKSSFHSLKKTPPLKSTSFWKQLFSAKLVGFQQTSKIFLCAQE